MQVNDVDYFAPLSSFKEKHKKMKESLDFIKVKDYAVINLNNMFPVPRSQCTYINIYEEKNPRYRDLLRAEYRFIKQIQNKIRKNAQTLYRHKTTNDNKTSLAKRCNDFLKLEKLCKAYD